MNYSEILKSLKKQLDLALPNKIDRIIFYGSRNEGNEHSDSDIDILVVLNEDFDWKVKDAIYDLCYELDLTYSLVSDIRVISKFELEGIRGKQPYIMNALENGVSA